MEQSSIKCDQKIVQLISSVHQKLKNSFYFIKQTRQLSEDQNQLLQYLNRHSTKYKSLVGMMAIDTYATRIVDMFEDIQSLFQIAVISMNCLQTLKNQILVCEQFSKLKLPLQNVFKSLLNIVEIIRQIVPQSPYNQTLDLVIANGGIEHSQNIYKELKEQNQNLKIKLANNDQHILNLQIKLTKLLNQHEECQGNVNGILSNFELREEINHKNMQIQKMNEQFSTQIEKYNVVYESLKRQLNEYRSYQNIDLIQQIQFLQTEIVRLREEKERDQMIIQELRQKSIYSQSNYQYSSQINDNYLKYYQRQGARHNSNRYK